MSVEFAYRNPFLSGCYDNINARSFASSPCSAVCTATIADSGATALKLSTGRYIQQLEVEVEELTQQYNAACQLLYRAVFVQDASAITVEEGGERRHIIEEESSARTDLVRLFFHVTWMRRREGLVALPHSAVTPETSSSFSALNLGELTERIASALREPLHEENERITQLVEAVPERVCVALGSGDKQMAPLSPSGSAGQSDAGSGVVSVVVLQQLEHVMARITELSNRLNSVQDVDSGSRRLDRRAEAGVTSLQSAVKGLEDSSRRLAEVVHFDSERAAPQFSTQQRPEVPPPPPPPQQQQQQQQYKEQTQSAVSSPLPTSGSKGAQDFAMLQKLSRGVVAALGSLMSEYMFFAGQKQMVAEQETEILMMIRDKGKEARWNRLIDEKDSEIKRLRDEVAKLLQNATVARREISSTPVPAVESVPLAQLYARFAGPFLPPNARKTRGVALQSIAKLREEASRVGVRPAANVITTTAAAAAAAGVAGSSSVALKERRGIALPDIVAPQSRSSSPPSPSKRREMAANAAATAVAAAATTSFPPPSKGAAAASTHATSVAVTAAPKVVGVAPTMRQLNRSLSSSSGSSTSPVRAAKSSQASSNTAAVAVAVGGGRKSTVANHACRVSRPSAIAPSRVAPSTPKSVEKGRAEVVLENSFDESTESAPKGRRGAPASSRGGAGKSSSGGACFVGEKGIDVRKNESKGMIAPQRARSRSVSSNSSAASVTLTLDSSPGSRSKERPRAAERSAFSHKMSSSFDSDGSDAEAKKAVTAKTRNSSNKKGPGGRASSALSGLKALSFSANR